MSRLPQPRGPLSAGLIETLTGAASKTSWPTLNPTDPFGEDEQLALYVAYELHYRGFDDVDERWEWEPTLLEFRAELEHAFEGAVLGLAGPEPEIAPEGVGTALMEMVRADDGPPLSNYIERQATREQFLEFVIHRSAYQLKEADPHSFAIPRIDGAAKSALLEVQADEYGGGNPERMHSALFAKTMGELGLDPTYGAYLDRIPASTLATVNLISLFGLHRHWRGAIVGHLAAFETTSPVPNRRYAKGLRRLGYGPDAADFYDEHVEADSVHENIATYDLAEGLARAEPGLAGQILFGARALLELEARFAAQLLTAWEEGSSSLRSAGAWIERGSLPAAGGAGAGNGSRVGGGRAAV